MSRFLSASLSAADDVWSITRSCVPDDPCLWRQAAWLHGHRYPGGAEPRPESNWAKLHTLQGRHLSLVYHWGLVHQQEGQEADWGAKVDHPLGLVAPVVRSFGLCSTWRGSHLRSLASPSVYLSEQLVSPAWRGNRRLLVGNRYGGNRPLRENSWALWKV